MNLEESIRQEKLNACEGLLQSVILLIEFSNNKEVLKHRLTFEKELEKLNEINLN